MKRDMVSQSSQVRRPIRLVPSDRLHSLCQRIGFDSWNSDANNALKSRFRYRGTLNAFWGRCERCTHGKMEDQEVSKTYRARDKFLYASRFQGTGSKNWCPASHINRHAPQQEVHGTWFVTTDLIVKVPGNLGNDCTSQSVLRVM